MDSGVRVVLNGSLVVQFTARTQRSDAPSAHADELFRRVREEIGEQAGSRGYEESRAEIVEVKDPVDEARVLDVWHEVTIASHSQRSRTQLPKCVGRSTSKSTYAPER